MPSLISLLGELGKDPDVAELLKNVESLDWSLPLQRAAMKKKRALIRPDLQPRKILRVGGVQEQGDFLNEEWITKNGRHILVGGPAARNGTLSQHFHAAQGKWDEERAADHAKTVKEVIGDRTAPEGRKPIAYILGGGTATGKTTESNKLLGVDPKVLRVDPDEVKGMGKMGEEYQKLKQTDPENAAARVHDESSFVTSQIMNAAIQKHLDLTYDATTSGNGGPTMAKRLIAEGYTVRAMFFNVPISLAKERQKWREEHSTDKINKGRHVKDSVIETNHYGAAKKFQEIKDIPGMDRSELFETTSDKPVGVRSTKPPTAVYTKSGDKETIHEPQLWEIYKLKGQKLHEGEEREAATGELERQSTGPVSHSSLSERVVRQYRAGTRGEKSEGKEVRKFRQKRNKAKVYTQSPTYWTIGQLGIPYGATAMGDVRVALSPSSNQLLDAQRRHKPKRRPTPVANQLGQRFWMGIGGGLRSQYGDYNQARPLLHIVSEQEHWITKDGRRIEIGRQTLHPGSTLPPANKPVVVVLGGSFNPPHEGHVEIASTAAQMLRDKGYQVPHVVIAPTADKLIKSKLPDRMSLEDRTELSRLTFTDPAFRVTDAPAKEAEETEGKLRRTQLADWVAKEYPGHTVVNVTGEDAAPGHPPGFPSVYQGDKGSNHEGYYYLALARPQGGISSSVIRKAAAAGEKLPGMTQGAERRFLEIQAAKKVNENWVTLGDGRHILIGSGATLHGAELHGTATIDGSKLLSKEEIQSTVLAEAKKLGIGLHRVSFTDESRTFKVGDVEFKEGAHANLKDGTLTFRTESLWKDFASADSIKGIVAHEVEHLKYESAMNAYHADLKKLHELEDTFSGPAENHSEFPRTIQGNLKPEFKDKFPLVARFEPTERLRFSEMTKADGVSDYSKAYWREWEQGRLDGKIAFHETVAEITRLKVMDPNGYAARVKPVWKQYVKAVDQTAKEAGF